jgi:hypothetical protein
MATRKVNEQNRPILVSLKLLSEEENAYIYLLKENKWVYSVNGEPKKAFKQISVDHSRNEVIVQDQETKEYRKLTGKRDYVGKSLDQMHETNLLTKWQPVWKANTNTAEEKNVTNVFYRISDSFWVEKLTEESKLEFKLKFHSYNKFDDSLILYAYDRDFYIKIEDDSWTWGNSEEEFNYSLYKGKWILPPDSELSDFF